MVGKKLLSEVLNVNCTAVELPLRGSQLGFQTDNKLFLHLINIYELAHKCKEWALEQGFQLESATNKNGGYCHIFYSDCVPTEPLNETKTVSSETHAVFNDCEWILTNKET